MIVHLCKYEYDVDIDNDDDNYDDDLMMMMMIVDDNCYYYHQQHRTILTDHAIPSVSYQLTQSIAHIYSTAPLSLSLSLPSILLLSCNNIIIIIIIIILSPSLFCYHYRIVITILHTFKCTSTILHM